MTDWRHELSTRLQGLELRPEQELEIVEELAQHLDDEVRDLVANGATPDAARAAALADLDEPGELRRRLAAILERPRLQLPPPGAPSPARWFAARWQDLRFAVRSLRRSPGFTAAVVATLALTIGPTTALLSIGNWLLWRPTPGVRAADDLGIVTFGQPTPQYLIVSPLSSLNLADLRAASRTLAGISGLQEQSVNLAAGSTPAQEVRTAFVSADFFETLGVRITAGRGFRSDEDQPPHGAHVAVITDGLAAHAFGGAPAALGQRVLINGRPLTVIGVTPREFIGTGPLSRVGVWIPGATYEYVRHYPKPTPVTRASGFFGSYVIRVKPGATFAAAEAELNVLLTSLVERYPDENTALAKVRASIVPGIRLRPFELERYSRGVGTLAAIGAVLLLLGCANVANLAIVRSIRGQRERAVRLALGASRSRLAIMQLTESVVLSISGALLGLLLAVWLKQFVVALLVPAVSFWSDFAVPLDLRVLGLTAALSIGAGVVAGLLPALLGARTQAIGAVVASGARAVTGARFRAGLAIGQLALSLALVTGAFMLLTTLRNVMGNDLGFDPQGVTIHQIDATKQGYSADRTDAYYRDMFRRLTGAPGWEATAFAATAFGPNRRLRIHDPATGGNAMLNVFANAVTARYFDVFSLRLLAGRVFTEEEAWAPASASPGLVVINEALARRAFGRIDALGERLLLPKTATAAPRAVTVIGVTDDARWQLTEAPVLEIFFPLTSPEYDFNSLNVLVKSAAPLRSVTERVQAAAMTVDPNIPVPYSVPFDTEIERRLADRLTFAWVLSILGGLGFTLAAVGLYGILAQSVAERTREFGVRLAIGSGRGHIFRLVLGQAAWIGGIGVFAGIGLALWGSRLIEAHLFGVSRWSPGAYVGAAAALVAIVFIAGLSPARTATRIEPVQALRVE